MIGFRIFFEKNDDDQIEEEKGTIKEWKIKLGVPGREYKKK